MSKYGNLSLKAEDYFKDKIDEIKNISALISNNFSTSKCLTICNVGNGVVVVGAEAGKIGRSLDYGRTWETLATSNITNTNKVNSIAKSPVTDTLLAVADGGEMVRSTDGGETWSDPITNPFSTSVLKKVKCDKNGVFHVIGASGKYAKSTDDGLTWSSLITVNTGSVTLNDIYINDNFMIIVAESKKVVRSTNGGTSWSQPISVPFVASSSIISVDGYDDIVVYGVTNSILVDHEQNIAADTHELGDFIPFDKQNYPGGVIAEPSNISVAQDYDSTPIPLELDTDYTVDLVDGEYGITLLEAGEFEPTKNLQIEFDSIPEEIGNYAISKDGGVSIHGSLSAIDHFRGADKNIIELKNIRGTWFAIGEGGIITYSNDLYNWNRISDDPLSGNINDLELIDTALLFAGDSGAIAKTQSW